MTILGTASILRADARAIPLPDNSVDLVVTSPPYFALRSYTDAGEHYEGQIGSEASPREFLEALLEVTRECMRVLKPTGSMWVNLGDKYSDRAGPEWAGSSDRLTGRPPKPRRQSSTAMAPRKSLLGLPWRYALACIDDLGLILRAEVIWSKPNGLPESVTDRVRRSHEQWFYFEQSRGEVVEPDAQALPLCSLCGRPADTRATLIARLHELDPSVEDIDLPDDVGSDERVQREGGLRAEEPRVVRPSGTTVPLAVPSDADLIEDAGYLLDDGQVSVVDQDAEVRAASAAVGERNTTLSVDDAGEPSEVCRCSHPLIVNEEPWIPQSLAAELMQMVADGEADPQSVADFLSGDYARSHSTWFHFTLQPRYFSAVDEIREAPKPGQSPAALSFNRDGRGTAPGQSVAPHRVGRDDQGLNPLGKLPGSVWSIATEPLTVPDHLEVDHFAAFPTEWPKRIIAGWSPSGVCVDCGTGRRPVVSTARTFDGVPVGPGEGAIFGDTKRETRNQGVGNWRFGSETTITGYACACAEPTAPTTPAVVLDPFGGTGTTAMVAKALGRHGISVDMSADYCRLATWRTNDRDQLAKVLGIGKNPDPVDEHQLDLFGEVPA